MTKNLKYVTATAVIAIALAGCGQRPSKPSVEDAQAAVDAVTYAKDARTGQCYAVLESLSNGDIRNGSLSISWVPCSDGVLKEISGK